MVLCKALWEQKNQSSLQCGWIVNVWSGWLSHSRVDCLHSSIHSRSKDVGCMLFLSHSWGGISWLCFKLVLQMDLFCFSDGTLFCLCIKFNFFSFSLCVCMCACVCVCTHGCCMIGFVNIF